MGTSDLRPREHLLAGGACPSWMERRLEGEAASGEGISRESKQHRVWALWGRDTAPQHMCVCGGGCAVRGSQGHALLAEQPLSELRGCQGP